MHIINTTQCTLVLYSSYYSISTTSSMHSVHNIMIICMMYVLKYVLEYVYNLALTFINGERISLSVL
jgi:hypothetical protein